MAPSNPIITTLKYVAPQAHFRYTTICCVYVYVFVYVYVCVFGYVFVYVCISVCVFVYVFVVVYVYVTQSLRALRRAYYSGLG